MKSLSLVIIAAFTFASGCVAGQPQTPKTPVEQLTAAAVKGDKALVQKLLAEGVIPGEGLGTHTMGDGIGMADYAGHDEIVRMLVDKCREVYAPGQNCPGLPCWAAKKGDPALLASVVSKGLPQINSKGSSGTRNFDESTLLHCAAYEGNVANARWLIAKGADIDKVVTSIETQSAGLAGSSSSIVQSVLVKNKGALSLLARLRPREAAAPVAGGGITKDEMMQMLKSAAAAKEAPAPAAPAEIRSDVDMPAYKVAANPDAFAIVVGVEKYNSLPAARFAERDARAMNAHLLAMGYPQRNIVLLTGTDATRTGLVKNLEAWLPNQVTERSTVLFYFSGHGAPDAKTSEAYLVPMDGDPQYLEETAYPIKRLYEKLGALKAKRVLVALDSCFSGAGGRSVLASGMRPLVSKLKLAPTEAKVVSLAASSAEEITGALEEQGHGLFTYHLLKALSETAGRGSVSELHAALTPRVQDEARRQNRAQTPQMFGASVDGGLR